MHWCRIGVVYFLATKELNHYKMPPQILDMLELITTLTDAAGRMNWQPYSL